MIQRGLCMSISSIAPGVDLTPFQWTLHLHKERCTRWQTSNGNIRRSSGDRWSSWSRRGVNSPIWRTFGCTGWSIRQWVKQADRDSDRGDGGLTSEERQELTRLRRENRQLKLEREILSKAAAWFAKESTATPKRSSDS